VAPWMLYNASVSYNLTDDLKVSAIVNNIKNSMPPKDPTYTAAPYYNFLTYNPYGRAYWLEIDWRFGRAGKD
jgi:outer membrane receptor for ferrienterochelin and colicin